MNVAFCVDGAYWNPMRTALASLLSNNRRTMFQVFIVCSSPVPAADWESLEAMAARTANATLHCVPFEDSQAYAHLPTHSHLSLAIYLRLFLGELLPASVERVLYLDSDLLICTDRIEDLWNTELGEAYLGAALEPFDERQRSPLGFGPDDFYFNAGVMLLNLRKWRQECVLEAFLAFADSNRAKLYSPDQDILNAVFRGNVVDVGIQWNWQALFPRLTPQQLRISPETYAQCKRAPAILHFTSRYKPWSWKWAPHYQSAYVKVMKQHASLRPTERELHYLPVKMLKSSQRMLEWYLPSVAGALRDARKRRRHAHALPFSPQPLQVAVEAQSVELAANANPGNTGLSN